MSRAKPPPPSEDTEYRRFEIIIARDLKRYVPDDLPPGLTEEYFDILARLALGCEVLVARHRGDRTWPWREREAYDGMRRRLLEGLNVLGSERVRGSMAALIAVEHAGPPTW